MATKCLSLVKGRRIRLTKLDNCGRPIYGEDSQAVSKGFISVALTANTTDSDEINVTNAAGEVCVYEPSETSLTGYGVEITFCEVDPELFALATSQSVYLYNGDAVGFSVNTKQEVKNSFALELWAGSASGDACTDPDAQGSYGYLLLPFLVGGIIGDFTVENGAVTFTITGANTKDGNSWGVGPYTDIFAPANALPTPISATDALLTILTTHEPPTAYCGTRPIMDPASPALTAIDAVATGLSVTFNPTPADITTPVYYDFGDGTWDYLDASALGGTTHVYKTAGTYTVKATTNGTVVTTTATPTGP